MNNKPNIVLFVADQMRCDSMHHMGNDASVTPHLKMLIVKILFVFHLAAVS